MKNISSYLLVLLLFGCFAVVAYLRMQAQARAGKHMPAYSVYSTDRNGLAAAARLVRRLGWEPVAVTRPIQHTHDRGLLVIVEPAGKPDVTGITSEVSEADARALVHWVERGNTLLLCGRQMTPIHTQLHVDISSASQTDAEKQIDSAVVGDAGAYTDGMRHLAVEGRATVQSPDGLALWWLNDDPAAVLLARGQGRVLVVADPSLLTLRGLRREDNVRFLYNVVSFRAQDGRVYFDEYHHGLQSAGGVLGYVRFHDQQWMLFQILAMVGMAVWAGAVRLGPAVPEVKAPRTDSVDYASAMARIYQRAGVRRLLARALVRDFMGSVCRYLRLRPTALPAEILGAWRRYSTNRGSASSTVVPVERDQADSGDRLQELLRGVAQLRKGAISERHLLEWARAFDGFKAEVMRGR